MDIASIASSGQATGVMFVAGVLTLASGYRYWRKEQSGDAKEKADSEGQIAALGAWKELLEAERSARVRAEERADRFAHERNEALQQMGELRGQLKAMTDELHGLRDQVRQLKDQIDAQ